jgi:hypothetical protein
MPRLRIARTEARRGFVSTSQEPVTPGAELFALCQTAAADGALSRRELQGLRGWLERDDLGDIPALRHVRAVVEHILDIGRAAPADLQALAVALEPTLPAELRKRPAALRVVDREIKARWEPEATERLRNEILASAHFLAAGCQTSRCMAAIAKFAQVGAPLVFVRNRGCAEKPNAVEIRTANGKLLGYVPEPHASEIAPLLDQGARYRAHVANICKGTQVAVLIVQAYLYGPNATLGSQSIGGRRLARREPSKIWWVLRFAIAALIAAAVAFVLRTP